MGGCCTHRYAVRDPLLLVAFPESCRSLGSVGPLIELTSNTERFHLAYLCRALRAAYLESRAAF
jgi:hypothetical protein